MCIRDRSETSRTNCVCSVRFSVRCTGTIIRTPDAHFFTEVRYKGAKVVAVTPDYAEVSKLSLIHI